MDWSAVRDEALRFIPALTKICPRYLEEIKGLAAGAKVDALDIVALNVRTEIAFGLFTLDRPAPPSDGCTSIACKPPGGNSIMAQNWDWQLEQTPNLVVCRMSQPQLGLPDIAMVTEGGIIGKIGLNAAGVGVCMNAIRARGLDVSRLPIHMAMRMCLESRSRLEAIDKLKSFGTAGSGHILVGDPAGSTGLECTSIGIQEIAMDADGIIAHANNLILAHPGVDEPPWLEDSPKRTRRMSRLLRKLDLAKTPIYADVFSLFKDEEGYPNSICRCQAEGGTTQTLFYIVMDLTSTSAVVTFGRPTVEGERMFLGFDKASTEREGTR
jgi:isopenicillin-N N-acyltransferase-like protein